MTNTLTTDVKATIDQINAIHEEGADIVRVSCPDEDSTKALKEITNNVKLPVIADIHFHYKRAIEAAENGAKCLRINPGNIGDKQKIHDVLSAAKNNDCSIRIGVNAGSLEKDILEKYKEPCPEALVESALRNIKVLEDQDFFNFKVSVKSSDVFLSIAAYRPTFKSNGLSITSWNYRSWKFCLWKCEIVYWTWNVAFRRNWRHYQNFTF
jgi:(E)-4-hydroxy-3-methylbut-2-enyl-diphosphate synthase